MHPKILITGSGGFVFSNFIRKACFQKAPYDFASIDACLSPHSSYNFYVNRSHKFHIANLSDQKTLDVIFNIEKPDIVIHGAGLNRGTPKELLEANVVCTQNLLEVSKKHNVKKFLFMSSSQVYGVPNDAPSETYRTDPKNYYAASKVAAENLIKLSGVPYLIARCCNIFGSRQSLQAIVPKIIKSLIDRSSLTLSHDVKSWIYVEDVYNALFALLERGNLNEVYNVAANNVVNNWELAKELSELLEQDMSTIISSNESLAAVTQNGLQTDKLLALKWLPEFKFKKGLQITTNWFVNNPWALKE